MSVQAVLLAGGRGRRLGGEDKALLLRDGRPLILHWQEALEERRVPFVVVGPEHLRRALGPEALLTREKPVWGGPAAAARTGALVLDEGRPWTLLLAVDVVDPAPLLDWVIQELMQWKQRAAVPGDAQPEAMVPRDGEGRLQYLSSAIASSALHRRAADFSDTQIGGRPLRVLLEGFRAVHPTMPERLGEDIDTPEDALRHRVLRAPEGRRNGGSADEELCAVDEGVDESVEDRHGHDEPGGRDGNQRRGRRLHGA